MWVVSIQITSWNPRDRPWPLPTYFISQNICCCRLQHLNSSISQNFTPMHFNTKVGSVRFVSFEGGVGRSRFEASVWLNYHRCFKTVARTPSEDLRSSLRPELLWYTELQYSYFCWLIYFPYSSWDSQYHQTPKFDGISCKSATFLFNLEMHSTNRKNNSTVLVADSCTYLPQLLARSKWKLALTSIWFPDKYGHICQKI